VTTLSPIGEIEKSETDSLHPIGTLKKYLSPLFFRFKLLYLQFAGVCIKFSIGVKFFRRFSKMEKCVKNWELK
jgi:hypothetical protein